MFLQNGNTPLYLAAESGSQAIVELLLDKRVNAEIKDEVDCCFSTLPRLVELLVCI